MANNQRIIEHGGEIYTYKKLAEETGLHVETIKKRIQRKGVSDYVFLPKINNKNEFKTGVKTEKKFSFHPMMQALSMFNQRVNV